MRKLILLIVILLIVLIGINAAQQYLPEVFKQAVPHVPTPQGDENVRVVTEESVTIDIVKEAGPSVVTVAEEVDPTQPRSPFDYFFNTPEEGANEPQSIGTGFVVNSDGLIVTNKHVVSGKQEYVVISNDEKIYPVERIYRDPLNDIALLQIDPSANPGERLPALELGDSSQLQVGQYVIAIGTALGEFSNTVTTGIISGLGRGITAGSPYEGSVERLDNVIQTDAAINPGNSGGPLLNSSGQVIGVNTAVSAAGQNIGFAIPINTIKASLENFNETGRFDRAYLGVAYQMVTSDIAALNDIPQGAYVQEVIQGTSADEAGIQEGDIITEIDGQRINDETQLAVLIGQKQVGDSITLTIYRDGETLELDAILQVAPEE